MTWDQWLNELERLDFQLTKGPDADLADWMRARAALHVKMPSQAATPAHLPRLCQSMERGETILERLVKEREASREAAENLYRSLHLTQAARFTVPASHRRAG